jgi:ParB-like chromosome segregation protein Spo0J
LSTDLDHNPIAIEPMPVGRLRPSPCNARTHSKKQIRQIAESIRTFGFTNPVLIGDDDEIIAGHGRVEAAKLIGLETVPTVRLSHLDAVQRRAYLLADNKLALDGGWDHEALAMELKALVDLDCDVEITGFSVAEVELLLDEGPGPAAPARRRHARDLVAPSGPRTDAAAAATRSEEPWRDLHRLLCAECRKLVARFQTAAGEPARRAAATQALTDPAGPDRSASSSPPKQEST